MKSKILLLALISISAFSGSNEAESWAVTGLKVSDLNQDIDSCFQSNFDLFACREMANVFVSFLNKDYVIEMAPVLEDVPHLKPLETIMSFYGGFIQVVKIDRASLKFASEKESLEHRNKTLFTKNAYWTELYKRQIQLMKEKKEVINFQEIFEWLSSQVIPANKEKESMIVARAINAKINVFDGHGRIEPYVESRQMLDNSVASSMVGIGIGVEVVSKTELLINVVIENSPAEVAGLREGDKIIAVNKEKFRLAKEELGTFIDTKIKGAEGTQVKLTIDRKGQTFDRDLTRSKIEQKVVSGKIIENGSHKIASIRLESFMYKNAAEEIQSFIQDFEKQGAQAIILDLRYNGGGLMDEAIEIADLFLGADQVIVEQRPVNILTGKESPKHSRFFKTLTKEKTNIPLVVMINAKSASASELLAGALQDTRQNTYVVGERSFGKGTVQTGRPIALTARADKENPNGMIFNTTARFYRPSGVTNQIVGVLPNFEVPSFPDITEEEKWSSREADLVPNALAATSATALVPNKDANFLKVEACLGDNSSIKTAYAKAKEEKVRFDYQLRTSEQILNCALDLGL